MKLTSDRCATIPVAVADLVVVLRLPVLGNQFTVVGHLKATVVGRVWGSRILDVGIFDANSDLIFATYGCGSADEAGSRCQCSKDESSNYRRHVLWDGK